MMDISQIKLGEIQPSQFYISQTKLNAVAAWFDPHDLSNFSPVPIKLLNGRVIFTDGHTRALAAHRAGLDKIPLMWDEDDMDWEAYQLCVDASIRRGISCIADLNSRVLSGEDYAHKWNGWCDRLHEALKEARLGNKSAKIHSL